MPASRLFVAALGLLVAGATLAAPGDQPVQPLEPEARPTEVKTQTTSIPARGLFDGDKLTPAGRQKLAELVLDALGLQVEVALLMPTGPWRVDERGTDERALTPARLEAVKRFLADRGVDPKHIYVESRIDQRLSEPRLDVQVLGRTASD